MKKIFFEDVKLLPVEGGEFLMGDDAGEFDDEKPAHPVRISSFLMARLPVTQRLWQAVMGDSPSRFKGERRPVENVSWHDVQKFLDRLNGREDVRDYVRRLGCPGQLFRLPTEAEWEYAARGGRRSEGYRYSGSDRLSQVGWFDGNSGKETQDVGRLLGNELELHDMSGNVWEWCSDWYSNDCYAACLQQGVAVNPAGPAEGTDRVLRGGSYFHSPLYCRSVYRSSRWPEHRNGDIGFRLALSERGEKMNNRKNLLFGKFYHKASTALWGWRNEHNPEFEHSDCNDKLSFLLTVGDALSGQPRHEVWVRHGMLFVKKSAVLELKRSQFVDRAGQNWRCLLIDGREIGYFAADDQPRMEGSAWWWSELLTKTGSGEPEDEK